MDHCQVAGGMDMGVFHVVLFLGGMGTAAVIGALAVIVFNIFHPKVVDKASDDLREEFSDWVGKMKD